MEKASFDILSTLIIASIAIFSFSRADISLKIFAVIFGIGITGRYIYQSLSGLDQFVLLLRRYPIDLTSFYWAYLLSTFAAITYLAGFAAHGILANHNRSKLSVITRTHSSLIVALVFFFAIATVQSFLLIKYYGSLEASMTSLIARRIPDGTNAFIASSLTFLLLAFSTVVISYALQRRTFLHITLATALTLFLTIYASVIIGRSYAIAFALSVLIVAIHRRRFQLTYWIGIGIFFLAIVVAGQAFRVAHQSNDDVSYSFQASASDVVGILSDNIAIVEGVAFARVFVDQNGFRGGRSLFSSVVTFIPRDLWPNKPLTVPLEIQHFLSGADTSGIPIGIFGELYLDFGPVGLLLGSFLLGMLMRSIYLMVSGVVHGNNSYLRAAAIFLFATFVVAMLRSGSQSALIISAISLAFWMVMGLSLRKANAK